MVQVEERRGREKILPIGSLKKPEKTSSNRAELSRFRTLHHDLRILWEKSPKRGTD